jgi:ATP-binding protein involved in chromosome partitioning
MSEPKKIPVLSLKGGTGKTTVCLDIARALRDTPFKVGLLDVDIHASALPRALHLEKPPGYEALLGGKLRPIQFDGFQIFSIGLLFPEDAPNMWPGDTKASAVKQIATTSIAWDVDLDWVVVDTPPTSGDEVQSLLANLSNIHGAVILCQPNDLAVLALAKTLNVLRETETPISGVIANMAGYRCPKCGFVSNPFDRTAEDVGKLAGKFGVYYLGEVPFGTQQERAPAIKFIVNRILSFSPITLKEKKGGPTRWLVEKLLK